jgi:tetratricopeptide (TPR) repeat protein
VFNSSRLVLLVFAFLLLLSPDATAAQDAAVLAGYRKFYEGDVDGARGDFERRLAVSRNDLPARFGILLVLEHDVQTNTALQPTLEQSIDALVHEADARYGRSEQDAEALFYAAAGYMFRARYRVNYDKGMWGAARDGARAKKLSDAYVARHPEHGDAYFTLGLYNYYVDIAPAFVRVLRVLMFLPAGNRVEGLKQVERAHAEGSLFAPLAGVALMEMYSTFESKFADAVRIGERLIAQYPDNPQARMALAEVYLSPAVEDHGRAADQYQAVIEREEKRAKVRSGLYEARMGLATAMMQDWRAADAIAALSATIDANPRTPDWAVPSSLLRRSNYRGLINDPGAPEDARRVRADARWKRWHKAADEQLAWIERRRASNEAVVYAALIPGNRLVAEQRWDEALKVYEVVARDYPANVQVRYRMAVLRFRRGEEQQAVAEFRALSENNQAPSFVRAQSLLYHGRTLDLTGRREEAKKVYERIVDQYERESAAWPARVGLITPYKR